MSRIAWLTIPLCLVAAIAAGCTNSPLSASTNEATNQDLLAAQPTVPTATMTVTPVNEDDPTNDLVVDIADQVLFNWTSANASQISSYYIIDSPDTCADTNGSTGPFPWAATTVTGNATIQFMTCQQGHTYTYSYVAQSATGQTTTSTVKVTVNLNGTSTD